MTFLRDAIEIVVGASRTTRSLQSSVVHSFCHITPSNEIDVRLDQPYRFSDFMAQDTPRSHSAV
jgi:hypothetical protein